MRLATWNLNNRVGKVRFRPEAASAAIALDADLIVFTEYFPQQYHKRFCQTLSEAGWVNQCLSQDTKEIANRVFIASRLPLERDILALADFDCQFPANTLAVQLPNHGVRILGLRIPMYLSKQSALRRRSWEWLEEAAKQLHDVTAVILGDLNVSVSINRGAIGASFHRILSSGWQRAAPVSGHSYFGPSGVRSEIDHVLATSTCVVRRAEYVTTLPGFSLAGSPNSLSDHAALIVDLEFCCDGKSSIPKMALQPKAAAFPVLQD